MNTWAMLASHFDDIEYIHYPVMVQCKLNGVRAKWTGEILVTRQNKVWKPETLPSVHSKLMAWSKMFPGVVLDGELYSHRCPWQILEGITSVNRITPHEQEDLIDFHAFDIIDSEVSEKRQERLSRTYDPWVAISLVTDSTQLFEALNIAVVAGFEGLMIRCLGCPYEVGRTTDLIKLKPWKYGTGKVVGFKEGKDKYAGMLGSIEISWRGVKVFISGGLSDEQRSLIWKQKEAYLGKTLPFKYRDLSSRGVPYQPQFVKI